MKQIVVISGKGGTGKTVITASFAALARSKIMADCDVDAADLHILLHPTIKERHEFKSGKTAKINKKICEQCGKCIVSCRFNAIGEDFVVDPVSCEGCGVCSYVCPVEAVKMEENTSGEWFVSDTKYGPFVHAKLGIAEENSGKLVTLVKRKAKEIAEGEKKDFVIIDGAPGIACPVIASLAGVDLALIVTEPTLSGIHDLERVNQAASHFKIKTAVCVNKFDINIENTKKIKTFCDRNNIKVLTEIPFDKKVVESVVNCTPFVEYGSGGTKEKIEDLYNKVLQELK